MNIAGADLEAEYRQAVALWPFLHDVEREHDLPPFILFAGGSRESGLRREFTQGRRGDPEPDGHGHGILQLDDRWHVIPDGFDFDAHAQAEMAATMLAGLHVVTADWIKALNRYNSGQDSNAGTTGGDYGPDVWERRAYLEKHFGGTMSDLPPVDDSPPGEDPERQRGPAPDPNPHG